MYQAENKWVKRAVRWAHERIDDNKRTGELTKLACKRYLSDLDSGKWIYDEDSVAESCEFFEMLPPPSGEQYGDRLVIPDWQVFLYANMEGFRKRKAPPRKGLKHARRFSHFAFWTARKSGKSTFAAVTMLKDLTQDNRLDSLQITAAKTEKQAGHVMKRALRMVKASRDLRRIFRLKPLSDGIARLDSRGGEFFSISGNASAHDGYRPTMVTIDEIHALEDYDLFSVLETGFLSTHSGIMLLPSTVGHLASSVGKTQYDVQVKLLKGEIEDDSLFSIIFAPDKDDDLDKVDSWYKANPGLGITVEEEEYHKAARKARLDPTKQTFFITRMCNRWRADDLEHWLSGEDWDACKVAADEIDKSKAKRIFIGVDASAVNDLTALSILYEFEGGRLHSDFKVYSPSKTITERANLGMREYDVWLNDGHIEPLGVHRIGEQDIAQKLVEIAHDVNPYRIIFDQYARAPYIKGFLPYDVGLKTRRIPKTARNVTEACRDLEARIVTRDGFTHDGNGAARWCVLNAHVERRVDESIVPKKEYGSSDKKVDAIDALVLAITGRMENDAGQKIDAVKVSNRPVILGV